MGKLDNINAATDELKHRLFALTKSDHTGHLIMTVDMNQGGIRNVEVTVTEQNVLGGHKVQSYRAGK